MSTLYVVATPIGNLKDITERAIEVLRSVDRIAAEDTRHCAMLLKHFSINKPTISLHNFNERERSQAILSHLTAGESIALVSDAGTPLISDPGFILVREAKAQGVNVVPIPGACALIAALSAAGLPTDKFIFEGFLPSKEETCRRYLQTLLHETRTMIFYEAPHRLLFALELMRDVFGETRKVTIARELTKIYESISTESIKTHIDYFKANPNKTKGEIVIILEGVHEEEMNTKEVIPEEVLDILLNELPLKQAVTLASKITKVRKNVLYEMALKKAK